DLPLRRVAMMRSRLPVVTVLAVLAVLLVVPRASAQTDGGAVFEKSCASCHTNPEPGSRAPSREILAQASPEAVLTSLLSGKMFQQGGALSDAERRAVAAYVAGRPLGTAPPLPQTGRCSAKPGPLTAAAIAGG